MTALHRQRLLAALEQATGRKWEPLNEHGFDGARSGVVKLYVNGLGMGILYRPAPMPALGRFAGRAWPERLAKAVAKQIPHDPR